MKFWFPLLLMGLALCRPLIAQKTPLTNDIWSFQNEQLLPQRSGDRPIQPTAYRVFHLDIEALKPLLEAAPLWQTEDANRQNTVLNLPMPDGTFQHFNIMKAPVMHPGLAIKYTDIQTFAGTGLEDPTAYVRFDLTPKGFHAMILSAEKGTVFIDPYSPDDATNYLVYYKKDTAPSESLGCAFDEVNSNNQHDFDLGGGERANTCALRTYRLALACTGEYAAYHGGSVESALAAMTTTLTRVNAIFERDASISLQLIENNDQLIFTNADSDPYHNFSGNKMLDENQSVCDNIIGSANYDIGHVFSTGGGGIAFVKSVCNNNKAGGVTGKSVPIGAAFDIDYVCHEMGHQFGANHTQNNNCNRNAATSVEPGSGSTIMAYAGVCSPNVQSNSDAYFHAVSLAEIASHINGAGGSCASLSGPNNAPEANPISNYTIPKSTNFVLTGSASDPDGNETLTFCWEQMDNEVAIMPPISENPAGPAFRSFPPSPAAERYFPKLEDLLENRSSEWEALPNVGRKLNFRLTVRDNQPGSGCTASEDVQVTVDPNAGPFVVTSPNTATAWEGGSQQSIAWSVAGTNTGAVKCTHVDILLSLDGGHTYPIVLANAVANDGVHIVTAPNESTTQARIMVKAVGNIFFDISNSDFSIIPTTQFFVSITKTNVGCYGESTGFAKANASGGFGSYTYKWSNGATTQAIHELSPGVYRVTVTAGNQTTAAAVTISQPNQLKVNLGGTNATNGQNGTATANATGGTGSFTYRWSNGGNTSLLSGLAAGAYFVTVTDANQCTAVGSIALQGQSPADPEEDGTASKPDPNGFISAYPNPSDKATTIEFYQTLPGGPDILLYDTYGRLRAAQTLLTSDAGLRETTLDLSALESGCYAVHIVEANSRKVVKVVKE